VVAAPPQPPEPSLIDELLENPLILYAAAALLLLLLGFAVYRARQRKNAVSVDSSFLESRLQPDSFFGASGGQRIDTNDANVTGSSMVYSPSQLDAAGDVDPVAEADVYLAYGRDLQAEEILKEAIRVNPGRVAIHAKLLEIYAKRRDIKAFEAVATDAFHLTRGQGLEWAHVTEMGRDLDPTHAMYQPGGQPASAGSGAVAAAASAGGDAFAPQTQRQDLSMADEVPAAAVDFDLDLDFSLEDERPASAAVAPPVPLSEPTLAMPAFASAPAAAPADNRVDFSMATAVMPVMSYQAAAQALAPPPPLPDLSALSFTPEPEASTAASPVESPAGMLEFDLGDLSLDLDSQTTESQEISTEAGGLSASSEDPLETKFALAEEFRAIGDEDGARSLAEEVLAHASGSLKGKAQAFLSALS